MQRLLESRTKPGCARRAGTTLQRADTRHTQPMEKKSAQRLERRQISYKPHFSCNTNKLCSRNIPLLLEKFTWLAPSLEKHFQAQSECKQMWICQRLWKTGKSLWEMAAPKKYTQDWLWNLMMVIWWWLSWNTQPAHLFPIALSAPATFQRAGTPDSPSLATKTSIACLRIQPGIFVLSFSSAMKM